MVRGSKTTDVKTKQPNLREAHTAQDVTCVCKSSLSRAADFGTINFYIETLMHHLKQTVPKLQNCEQQHTMAHMSLPVGVRLPQ